MIHDVPTEVIGGVTEPEYLPDAKGLGKMLFSFETDYLWA